MNVQPVRLVAKETKEKHRPGLALCGSAFFLSVKVEYLKHSFRSSTRFHSFDSLVQYRKH